jgi:hypothetical protein
MADSIVRLVCCNLKLYLFFFYLNEKQRWLIFKIKIPILEISLV